MIPHRMVSGTPHSRSAVSCKRETTQSCLGNQPKGKREEAKEKQLGKGIWGHLVWASRKFHKRTFTTTG
jgi:hypothetical protein